MLCHSQDNPVGFHYIGFGKINAAFRQGHHRYRAQNARSGRRKKWNSFIFHVTCGRTASRMNHHGHHQTQRIYYQMEFSARYPLSDIFRDLPIHAQAPPAWVLPLESFHASGIVPQLSRTPLDGPLISSPNPLIWLLRRAGRCWP